MTFEVNVNDIFTITSVNTDADINYIVLTKDKHDIFCCVSNADSTVVEFWETSPNESSKNLIFSTVYSNITTPSGANATAVVSAIKTLITS